MATNQQQISEVIMQSKRVWVRFSVVVALVSALVLVSSVAAQGTATVRVDPATVTVAPGQAFTLSIKVDNVTNLSAFEIHLAFDPAILQVTQAANGGLVSADFVAQNTADNNGGTLDYAVAQINKPAVNGSGTLVTINFTAKAAGTSQIAFRATPAAPTGVILADPNGMAIAVTLQPGTVTVSGPTQPTNTPTPTVTPGGPTATPTPTRTPGPTPTPVTGTPGPYPILGNHTVQSGESLYCIGRAYGISPWAIASQNSIPWPYTIYAGKVLAIPNAPWVNIPSGPICIRQFGTGPVPTPVPGTPVPTPVPGSCRAFYTIVWGDTLYSIAYRYNANVYTLAARNNIYNINLIYAGITLCIP